MLSLLSQDARDIIKGYVKAEPNLTLSIGVNVNGQRHILVIDKGKVSNEHSYLYDLGSITKIYTATLLSKLVCDGTMSLDDSIGKYLPIAEPAATLSDLATHFGYNPYLCPAILLTYISAGLGTGINFYNKQTRLGLVKYCNQHKFKTESQYSYSDMNYALIGEAIAVAKNSTYQEVMTEFLTKELGLTSTGFEASDKRLISYNKRCKMGALKWHSANPFISAGGLKTNIVDSLTFLEKCMQGKEDYQVLAQTRRKSYKGVTTTLGIGLGWNMYKSGNYLFHKGASASFRTNYIFDKRKKIAISILANAKGNINFNSTRLGIAIYKSLKKSVSGE